MTTSSATLWRHIQESLSYTGWSTLQDVYARLEGQIEFDDQDLLPEVGDAKQRRWHRNVRNVLQSAVQRFEAERDPNQAGRYRLCRPHANFHVGQVINRRLDLHSRFGGQQQGGISTPSGHPYVFLFTGESGDQHGYSDGWNDDGVFMYTGEGQVGDMRFVRGNLAIRDHIPRGNALLLFQSLGRSGSYRYIGEFCCATWERRRARDTNDSDRDILVFHLVPVEAMASPDAPSSPPLSTLGMKDLRKEALASIQDATESTAAIARRIVYERSQAVRTYVLARAKGICESCRMPAPFVRKDGTHYLEPHHTRLLSEGGPDHPRWVGAICPNCHSEIHFGQNGEAKNQMLQDYLRSVEE